MWYGPWMDEEQVAKPGRPTKYPWTLWANGQVHAMEFNRNEMIAPKRHVSRILRTALEQYAYRNGYTLRTRLLPVRKPDGSMPTRTKFMFQLLPKGSDEMHFAQTLRFKGSSKLETLETTVMCPVCAHEDGTGHESWCSVGEASSAGGGSGAAEVD